MGGSFGLEGARDCGSEGWGGGLGWKGLGIVEVRGGGEFWVGRGCEGLGIAEVRGGGGVGLEGARDCGGEGWGGGGWVGRG